MDNQNKTIIVLVAIIVILAIIFGLKVAGVIKPTENEEILNITENEEVLNNVENEGNNTIQYENMHLTDYESEDSNSFFETVIVDNLISFLVAFPIIINILIIINYIADGRIYSKLGMTDWMVKFTYCYPFINIFLGYVPAGLSNIIQIVLYLVLLVIFCAYFDAIGMRKKMAIRHYSYGISICFDRII